MIASKVDTDSEIQVRCDVLDDDPAVAEVISGILSRSGVVHRCFSRLDDLIAGMSERHPDLLFLDVKLAESDAVDVVRRLHAIGYSGHIQVVSGLDGGRLAEVYRLVERYGYKGLYPIGKPFRSASIRSALDHVRDALSLKAPRAAPPTPSLLVGWITAPAPQIRALVVQPHLLAETVGTDLFAAPGALKTAADEIASAILSLEKTVTPEIWVHISRDAALVLPLAALLATPGALSSSQLCFLVPLAEATAAPQQFSDLRTKLSVYGISCGVFADRLEQVSLTTLSASTADKLLFGQECVDQLVSTVAGKLLGERIVSACQAMGISVAALCTPAGEGYSFLKGLGVDSFGPPIEEMATTQQIRFVPVPQALSAAPQPLPVLPALGDFPGRSMLSEREAEIVHLTANGLSAKEAGRALGLSYRTVEVHRSNIFAKLGVKNVAQMTKLVLGIR